jgi:hypothetical protein
MVAKLLCVLLVVVLGCGVSFEVVGEEMRCSVLVDEVTGMGWNEAWLLLLFEVVVLCVVLFVVSVRLAAAGES